MHHDWRLIPEETHSASMNMAIDSVSALRVSEGAPSTIRLYRWNPSSLSIGYNQKINSINQEYCLQEKIPIVRRNTGGGGIYHSNFGDISYSITTLASNLPTDISMSYQFLLFPLLSAFKQLGISAKLSTLSLPAICESSCYLREIHPAHDLIVSGKKISGNAQKRSHDVVTQHGSITYSYDPQKIISIFSSPSISTNEVKNRITSISEQTNLDREHVIRVLSDSFIEWSNAKVESWSESEMARAKTLENEKFSSDEWTFRM
jgi:lipoate-protein ligase A